MKEPYAFREWDSGQALNTKFVSGPTQVRNTDEGMTAKRPPIAMTD